MTTVPPPGTQLPQMPAAPAAAPVVVILQPPPALAAAAPGTVIEAVVLPEPPAVEAAKAAIVTLRTALGDVELRLPVQLPDNARVAIEVLRAAAQATPQGASPSVPAVTVRVVSVDGQPAAQVLAQLARQDIAARVAAQLPPPLQPIQTTVQNPLLQTMMLTPGAAWTPAGPQQVAALGTISAFAVQGTAPAADGTAITPQTPVATIPSTTLVSAPPSPPAVPAFAAPTGSELSVRLTSVTLPAAAPSVPLSPNTIALIPPTAVASLVAPPVALPPTPIAILPQPSAPIVLTMPLSPAPQPGLVLPGQQGFGAPPPTPPLTVQTSPVLTTVTGTVVSISPNGAPIIETEAGPAHFQMQLNLRANLPVGTRLTFEITAQADPRPGAAPPVPTSALPLTSVAGSTVTWPTLTESIAVLQRIDPQAAQQLAQTIPDGGPRTAAALVSFAQALRTGDPRQWPGDANLRALERAGPRGSHLASQLSEEVSALSSRARETGTEWRALPIPWNADGQIDRIALITRREGEADDESKNKSGGRGTRFLINLDLSRLGSMQLDGMFRKETRGFDLMIRTKENLPDNIRHDLTGIFAASNAAMGFKGGLSFQVVKKFADPIGQANPSADKSGLWA